MKTRSTFLALAVALSLALSSQAHATAMLDFGIIAPTTGSISHGPGTAPLVGLNISVDNIVGLPTGGPLTCQGCVLNFTTGAAGPSTATTWSFGGGPTTSITVTGTAIDPNNSNAIVATGTLLSGTFGSATVTTFGSTFRIAGASFTDVKDPALLAFFGLPTGRPYNGNFNISFNGRGTPPGAFTSRTVLSGDIINEPVDLPSSLLLLGSGLVGFAFLTKRTRRS